MCSLAKKVAREMLVSEVAMKWGRLQDQKVESALVYICATFVLLPTGATTEVKHSVS